MWTVDVDERHTWKTDTEPNLTLLGADHETNGKLLINWDKLNQSMSGLVQDFGQNKKYHWAALDDIKYKFDILIIHQGLLDKWLPGEMKTSAGVDFFLDSLKEYFRYVVVTTGRGKPANIPLDARVIPFSCIESFLFQKYPEKLLLTDTIMNLLPYGDEANE